jgi:predicted SnoaL-like aldol condensation-catalyzing enzyme
LTKNKERAIVDIFRIENGKIVEEWDVIQKVSVT